MLRGSTKCICVHVCVYMSTYAVHMNGICIHFSVQALRDTSRSGPGCNVCWLLRDRLRWLYSSTATFDLETFPTMALLNPTCENDLVNSPYSSECGSRYIIHCMYSLVNYVNVKHVLRHYIITTFSLTISSTFHFRKNAIKYPL